MEITISHRRTELTPRLEDYVREKISRLDRFVEGIDHAEVHLFEEKNPRITDKEICEVTLEGHGHHVRCKVSAPDGFAAVDAAVVKLEKQLRKLKTRLVNRWHHSGDPVLIEAAAAVPLDEDPVEVEPTLPRIVKSKKFHIAAMTPDEAALELDLVNHDFYFFHNSETARAAIVYRRDDGDLGLIDEAG